LTIAALPTQLILASTPHFVNQAGSANEDVWCLGRRSSTMRRMSDDNANAQDPSQPEGLPPPPDAGTGDDRSSLFPDQLTDDQINGALELGTGRTYRAPCPGERGKTGGIVVRSTGMSRFAPANSGSCTAYLAFYDSSGAKAPTVTVSIDPGAQVDLTNEMSEYAYCSLKCSLDCNGDCVISFSDS
jgi:hypothetical protein